MPKNPIKVKFVYRNYIPLNSPYFSLLTDPPKGIEFFIPKTYTWLAKFFVIYKRFKSLKSVMVISSWVEHTFFKNTPSTEFDYYYYIGMLPDNPDNHKYVIDLEHIYFLSKNANDSNTKAKILNIFQHKNCIAITPLSLASKNTLKKYLGKNFSSIEKKIKVLYPAVPTYNQNTADYSIIPNDKVIKLLFIGKDGYRKGLYEVVEAFKQLAPKYPNLSLYIVSDTPKEILDSGKNVSNLYFFDPKFSSQEIIEKFFLPSDIFVMPTHEDTFGMVFLEALASGKPIITTRQFATTEIGEDHINALFLDNPPLPLDQEIYVQPRFNKDYLLDPKTEEIIINELVEKISLLLDTPKLLTSLKSNSQKEFEGTGKFSIKQRNLLCKEIFK